MASRRSHLSRISRKAKQSVSSSHHRRHRKSVYSLREKRRSRATSSSVHSPSNASITSRELLGIEIFDQSKNLWIERSKANIGVFKVVPFEYNLFDDTDHRILFVMPTIGTETLGGGEKPNVFSVLTCMGRDICDIKYSEVRCCKKAVALEVRVDDELFGVIQQVKQDFLIMDAETNLLMKVILKSATGGGLCSRGLKQLIWDVFLASDLTVTVGNVGRNGNKIEEVTLGQPRAFYFKSLPSDQIPEGAQWIDSTHKLLIASLLVGLMVTYSDQQL